MSERFKEVKGAFAIQGGRVWVSALNTPNDPMYQPYYRGRSSLVFAGVNRLELSVGEARALRDWLNSVLPDEVKS